MLTQLENTPSQCGLQQSTSSVSIGPYGLFSGRSSFNWPYGFSTDDESNATVRTELNAAAIVLL